MLTGLSFIATLAQRFFFGKSGCLYVRYEPATFTAYAGQNMISFRLVDLSSTEVFTAQAAE